MSLYVLLLLFLGGILHLFLITVFPLIMLPQKPQEVSLLSSFCLNTTVISIKYFDFIILLSLISVDPSHLADADWILKVKVFCNLAGSVSQSGSLVLTIPGLEVGEERAVTITPADPTYTFILHLGRVTLPKLTLHYHNT